MPVSPFNESAYKMSFTILSAGTEIQDTFEILELRIHQELNQVAEAEITLKDGEAAEQTFSITDSTTFTPGTEIEIKLGYEGQNDSIFKGIVVKETITIDNTIGSKLLVTCKDKAIKTTVIRNYAVFENETDSNIISAIINNAGLTPAVDSTSVTQKEMVQFNATDWDFINVRAEINGLVVYTDSGTLTVAKPAVSGTPALQLQFGYDILEFEGELDATYQYESVVGQAWDMSTQALIESTAATPTVNAQGDITSNTLATALGAGTDTLPNTVPLEQAAVQSWANAVLLRSGLSRFRGTARFQGSSLAKVNTLIALSGLSSRFNGNAYVSGVTHIIDDGNWVTEVQLGMRMDWFADKPTVSGPLAAGLLPGVKGLQTGIVTKTYEDPDNQFRVQVSIPIIGGSENLVWARLSSFYTGNTFGAFFMPEVNDEVILGFMNDDPRYPIILGSLYSSAIPPAQTPDQKNTVKSIVTQSKMQLKFDEEKKEITVLTPGGNQIVISDDQKGVKITDQNSNTITMNDQGIVVDSKSDLTLKAAQGVTIQGATVSITGNQTASMKGNQSATVSGGSQCTVSSDGQMVVKGTAVMIN
jgi:Rhs element Vgr protein